jgi:hypothetical protein
MVRRRARDYRCEVVSEDVFIRLTWRFGRTGADRYFVQCDQVDCQYVDENKAPCPLSVAMFLPEIIESAARSG